MNGPFWDTLDTFGDLCIIAAAPAYAVWIHRLRAENRRLRDALRRQKNQQTPS